MHTYTCFKFRRPRINAKRALPDNTSGSGLLSTMLLAKERKPSLPPWDGSWRGDFVNAAVLCLVAQLYLTLCNSMDYSSPGPSVHGILQQEYWSGLPGSPPGDLPKPGIEPRSPALQADSLPSEPPGKHLGSASMATILTEVYLENCNLKSRVIKIYKITDLSLSYSDKVKIRL